MNGTKNDMWKISLTLAIVFIGLNFSGLLFAQEKTPPKDLALKGRQLLFVDKAAEYSVVVSNPSDAQREDTRVVLYLPKHLNFIGSNRYETITPPKKKSPESITWNLGTLDPGKKGVIRFKVQAVKPGKMPLRFELSDSSKDTPQKATFVPRSIGEARLQLSSYDTEDPAAVGAHTIYVVEVRNVGSAPATTVKLDFKLPKEMKFVSAQANAGLSHTLQGDTVQFATRPILGPDQKMTYRIKCNVLKIGASKALSTLTYDQFDKPIFDEEGTSCYE